MTSIHIYDPDDGAALPELPPLPIGVLVVGTADLLQQAADLPQPRYITIYDGQTVDLQFAPEQASVRAITRWALRFGSVMTSQPGTGQERPRDLVPGATSTTTASPSRRTPTSRPHRPAASRPER